MNKKPNPELIDDDNPEWTDDMFAQSVRFDALPDSLKTKLRGKQKEPTKISVTVRYSPEVLAAFKATGKGWQTRMDDALKEWLREHSEAQSNPSKENPHSPHINAHKKTAIIRE